MANRCKENERAKAIFRRLSAVTPLVSVERGHRDAGGMSSRLSFSQYRLEAEVERCRAECQWDTIPSLLEQLAAARLHDDDDYRTLLLAEALLEECLLENMTLLKNSTPLTEDSQPKLARAKAHLNSILSRGRLEPHYLNEALLLLAKVHYVQGRYRDAQGMCARAGVDDFTRHERPVYQLRMLAEAFVIKGLSLDHQSMSGASRVRLSEREEECLSCYLMACDAGLLYLQELDKTVCTPSSKTAKSSSSVPHFDLDPGFFLQAALQSAYLSLLRKGHLAQGTQQLRRVMRAVESRGSQSFRKTVACRLAEVLLGSVCEDAYWGPLSPPPPGWLKREGATHPKDTIYPSSRPPQRYNTEGAFCPQDVVEEAVLVLLITESMPWENKRHLSKTLIHKNLANPKLLSRKADSLIRSFFLTVMWCVIVCHQCLERAMKFSYNEFHLWYQLGLSLMASGKNEGAVSVLKECVTMRPQDPIPPLLAAKVSINQLHWLEDAVSLSAGVVALGESAGESLPRAHLAIGLCRSLQASDAPLKADRDEFNRRALQSLRKAHALDPEDPQISFYLSLQLALVRQVSEAMEPLQLALNIRGDDLHSLHLLTLLLSAQKHYQHALDTLKLAIIQHPDNFNLLFTKVKLEEVLFGPAAALQTCTEMLQWWQSRYDFTRLSEEDDTSSIPPDPGPLSRKPSGLHLTLPDFQETETGSQSAPSLAVSRLEQAMSEVSALSSAHRHGPAYIWTTLERIWLQAGELFMADGRMKEAQFCVQEAGTLFPASHSVLLLKGRRAGLGEKMLRDAIQVENTAHEAWSGLGEALQSRGSAQAPDCFLTALELESSCPIRPFTIIPREL
ncbi:tetratricopeptide repeat protein 7A-like [Sinocyclocheilus rhinocerous]|uniref:tetratricopeptide repeat protein 7A-like n=1 Tax=Sinocyclocheilus rhinocerous TaxID=307959 RepID=UPI0007B8451F|nr:PREDICTED: tetratricopeptide repeat protein 7A-like [Sinocyclocheilus rhinocerous]